jgi:hypothetical protein
MSHYIGFSLENSPDRLRRRALRVPGAAERRFQRRWLDYCLLFERGTDPTVGQAEPGPPDRREEVLAILSKANPVANATPEVVGGDKTVAVDPIDVPSTETLEKPLSANSHASASAGLSTEDSSESAEGSRERGSELSQSEYEALLDSAHVPIDIRSEWLPAADAVLAEIWRADDGTWQRRLAKKFLDVLSAKASRAFRELVTAGSQPDMLAWRFQRAAQVEKLAKDDEFVLSETRELEKVIARRRGDLEDLLKRVTSFHERLASRSLMVLEDEPGTAELRILVADFEDWADRFQNDHLRYIRRQFDGRRQPLVGDAEIKLSLYVRDVTGAYFDTNVELVLNELRAAAGHPERPLGTLRKRRARWGNRLSNADA